MSDTSGIKVVFFASVRERLGKEGVELDAGDVATVRDVIARLGEREGEAWQAVTAGEHLLVAVNQTMAEPDHPVSAGDEVAFFPPVTGG